MQLRGRLGPLSRVLLQGPADNPIDVESRNVLAVLVEPIELHVAHHQQHVEIVRRGEQPAPGEQLGEHHADGEQIAARVDGRPTTCSGDM